MGPMPPDAAEAAFDRLKGLSELDRFSVLEKLLNNDWADEVKTDVARRYFVLIMTGWRPNPVPATKAPE